MLGLLKRPWLAFTGVLATLSLGIVLVPAPGAEEATQELIQKQEQQRQIQLETERTVRQMQAMIRVMQFYKLDKAGEQKLLDEAATALSGLSQNQMKDVIAQLEAAAKAPDGTDQDKAKAAAYAKHRE